MCLPLPSSPNNNLDVIVIVKFGIFRCNSKFAYIFGDCFGKLFLERKAMAKNYYLLSAEKCYSGCNRIYFFKTYVMLFVGMIPTIIPFIIYNNNAGAIYILYIFLFQFSKHAVINLVYDIIHLLRNKYSAINCTLIKIRVCAVIERSTIKRIQEAQNVYIEAEKLVNFFNKIFGWPLLLLLAQSVTISLFFLACVTDNSLKSSIAGIMSYKYVISLMIYTITIVVSSFYLDMNKQKKTDIKRTICYIFDIIYY